MANNKNKKKKTGRKTKAEIAREEELKQWISNGAVIYVCGSIQGMATDVDHALNDILGADLIDELRQQGRYRRDVY